MTDRPILDIAEWTRLTPDQQPQLATIELTDSDRHRLGELARHSRLRVTELRHGLAIETGPEIGTVVLSGLIIRIRPKLAFGQVLSMIASVLNLDRRDRLTDGVLDPGDSQVLVEVLARALAVAVERLLITGPTMAYRDRTADLRSPRGTIRLPPPAGRAGVLHCRYHELSGDLPLNRWVVTGVRQVADRLGPSALALRLRRLADRFPVSARQYDDNRSDLRPVTPTRQTRRYQPVLELLELLGQGGDLYGGMARLLPDGGFLLDMNRLFERFVTGCLIRQAPDGVTLSVQESRSDAYRYRYNPGGWQTPVIRPDLLFRRNRRIIAIGDVKYRDYANRPPASADLYQLTTYGLAWSEATETPTLLFYPAFDDKPAAAELKFGSGPDRQRLTIRLVGVPVEGLLSGRIGRWWPI